MTPDELRQHLKAAEEMSGALRRVLLALSGPICAGQGPDVARGVLRNQLASLDAWIAHIKREIAGESECRPNSMTAFRRALIRAFNSGYIRGHHCTVEGHFADIASDRDMHEVHSDLVDELISDGTLDIEIAEKEQPSTDAPTEEGFHWSVKCDECDGDGNLAGVTWPDGRQELRGGAAYKRGLREGVELAKERARLHADAHRWPEIDYRIDWSDVDAELERRLKG